MSDFTKTVDHLGRHDRQKVCHWWGERCFGVEQANSLPQRGLRFLEEAIELYQAVGGSADMAHKLVDYVFGRPMGETEQEVGGVSVTLLILCEAAGIDANSAEAKEINRILNKKAEHFTARNQAKNDAGLKSF